MLGGGEPSVTALRCFAHHEAQVPTIHLGTLVSVMHSDPMVVEPVVLEGGMVRLEPLRMDHLPALAEVAFAPEIWRWMPVLVTSEADLRVWMEQALDQAAIGRALPWVTWSKESGRIIGSTRYMEIDSRNRGLEIGGTWLAPPWQRSGVNVEAKYLQLRHAFEVLGAVRGLVQDPPREFAVAGGYRRTGRQTGRRLPQSHDHARRQLSS